MLANYHTTGPLPGKTVVMTHSTVLQALLVERLTVAEAENLGLIRFSGMEADRIKWFFQQGLQTDELVSQVGLP